MKNSESTPNSAGVTLSATINDLHKYRKSHSFSVSVHVCINQIKYFPKLFSLAILQSSRPRKFDIDMIMQMYRHYLCPYDGLEDSILFYFRNKKSDCFEIIFQHSYIQLYCIFQQFYTYLSLSWEFFELYLKRQQYSKISNLVPCQT